MLTFVLLSGLAGAFAFVVWWRLLARPAARQPIPGGACDLSQRLSSAIASRLDPAGPQSAAIDMRRDPAGLQATAGSEEVIRLYWWFRFQGLRKRSHWSLRCPAPTGAEPPITCVSDSGPRAFADAHATVVWVGARPERHCLPPVVPGQLRVVEFTEPPSYYPELANATFMRQFHLKVCLSPRPQSPLALPVYPYDCHPSPRTTPPRNSISDRRCLPRVFSPQMSYELDAALPITAVHPGTGWVVVPPSDWINVPWSSSSASSSPQPRRQKQTQKQNAVVWLAGNCDSRSNRERMVRRLIAQLPPELPLHSVGRCMHNNDPPRGALKPKTAGGGVDDTTVLSKVGVPGWADVIPPR